MPHLLKAAMNIRIAFEGVVPTCWVAAAKAAFSSGKTFATTGVMCSAMVSPNRYDTSAFARASGWAKKRAPGVILVRWYYLVLLSYTPWQRIYQMLAKSATNGRAYSKVKAKMRGLDGRWMRRKILEIGRTALGWSMRATKRGSPGLCTDQKDRFSDFYSATISQRALTLCSTI